jgi:hypothetical protein
MHKAVLFIVTCIFIPVISSAQDSLTKKETRILEADFLITGKPWIVEIPLWIPGFAGEFAYGDINIEGEDGIQNPIEPPPPSGGIGDILSRLFTTNWYLKFFYLTRVSYEQNKFKAQFDMISGAVGNSVVFNYNDKELVQASFLTLNLRLFAGYKFLEKVGSNKNFRYEAFVYGGVRTYFQRLQAEVNATNISLEIHPVWVEPIIGLENQFTWKRWIVALQADYGSITSKNRESFQLTGFAYYRMGSLTSIKFGWNHLYINRKDKYLQEDIKIKLSLSGPTVGMAFHF